MALELGKEGILCNAIAPGTIATEGTGINAPHSQPFAHNVCAAICI